MRINRPEMAWYLENFHDVLVPAGRQPKIRCPFHDDRTPSASVYRDTERLVCYSGCFDGRAVDVIDIEMAQNGLSFTEAAEKVKSWPGTLVDASSAAAGSTRQQRAKRQQRKPYSFKVLGG